MVAEQPVLPAKVIMDGDARIGQHGRDLFEAELQLPAEQDLLQSPQVDVGVQPVA